MSDRLSAALPFACSGDIYAAVPRMTPTPVIIAGVRGTAALLQSPPEEPVATLWIGLLTAFDVVFITLALWTFEPLMTE